MAKLYFRYGAMNCGKTSALLQVAYNYEEKGKEVMILKSIVDTKGDDNLVSRIGLKRKVDLILKLEDNIYEKIKSNTERLACMLVDEAQFLTQKQVTELWQITKECNIPVICYGLRTDFQTNGFPGSIRLMELADELEELVTICRCGKKAKFNARKVNGVFVNHGNQVAIDGADSVTYEPLCGNCYIEEFGGNE